MTTTTEDASCIVSTAHLLLRGLIPAFVGCSIGVVDDDEGRKDDGEVIAVGGAGSNGGVRASAFQMTYRKDMPKFGNDGE
ncbi:hypothetical protein ACHAXA_004996 [Cyclostephanos tholiformis]|uniref:Uncharacterized protein n=1 Tax=Cyclostephanos tholiformis TaxID=382380 RepID=A0ABD3R8H3_9STRA